MGTRFSPTALTTYLTNCQRRYFLDKEFPPPFSGPAAELGTAVHAALEQTCRLMAEKEVPARDAVELVADESTPEIAGYVRRALPVLEGLRPIRGQIETWLPWGGSPQFTGKVDCVSRTAPVWSLGELEGFEDEKCLIDWKTTGRPDKVMSEIDARRSLQSAIYCARKGIHRIAFVYFLPEGAPMGVTVRFTTEELKDRIASLAKVCAEIEQKLPEGAEAFSLHPSPGRGLCQQKWCPHWGTNCPVGQERP